MPDDRVRIAIDYSEENTKVGLRQMMIKTSISGKTSTIRATGIECDAKVSWRRRFCVIFVWN